MGDRALIQFKHGDEVSPVVYLHWNGSSVRGLLDETREMMSDRGPDLPYTAARFVGVCHSAIHPPLSLGIWNKPAELTDEDSHGDAGIFVVDVNDWSVKTGGGYGFDV